MRRALSLLLCVGLLAGCLPLGGCGSLYSNYREVEQLRVMQTLGLDDAPGGVTVTLAAAADPAGGAPPCFSAAGASVSAAIEAARQRSVEEDLFTGHLRQVLVGEAAARRSLEPILTFICRSPDVRLDMPLFILRDCTAREVMTEAGSGERGISEILQAAHGRLDAQAGGHVFTAGELLRSVERRGSGLVCALRYGPASESGGAPDAGEGAASGANAAEPPYTTAAFGGYAVIRGGALCEFLDPDAALGVDFLLNTVGIRELVVRDRFGAPVTLEIARGGTRLQPLWNEDGSLRGIEIYASVTASLLETGGALSAVESADYLTGQLEAAVSDRIGAALWLARTLETDYLGLRDRVEQAAPLRARRLETDLGALLPALELSIAVRGELRHSHDLEGGGAPS